MSITTTKYNTHENYLTDLKRFLFIKEEFGSRVYYKNGDTPTIGYGLALFAKKSGKLDNDALNDLKKAGVEISPDDNKTLQNIQKAMQKKPRNDANITLEVNKLNINLENKKKAKEVFEYTIKRYQKKLIHKFHTSLSSTINLQADKAILTYISSLKSQFDNMNPLSFLKPKKVDKLGQTLIDTVDLKDSKELIPLVSMIYNGGPGKGETAVIGPKLIEALLSGNRAEAWFEIRYNSNGGESRKNFGKGIATRRVAESNLFGLYNKTLNVNNPSKEDLEDMKDIIRMARNHKGKIIGTAKKKGEEEEFPTAYAGDNSIAKQIELAKIILINKYGKDVKIDGKSISTKDWITGDEKDNTLNGNKKDNILYGGKGADKLNGGKGDDTYIAGAGDTINDTDNKGIIYFDATLLSGTKHKVSENTYEDKMFTYTLDNKNLIITQKADTSKSIRVENWSPNKEALGIILSDKKVQSQTESQADPSKKSMSLLPPDAKYDNTQIAESSTNENKDDLANTEALAYVPGTLAFLTTIDAKDVVLASDTSNKNDDDNGMVM